MKLSRAELAILAAAALFLALTAGRAWGVWDSRALWERTVPAPVQSVPPPPAAEAEPSAAGTPEAPVDLNTAGMEELASLPGIGETRARAILNWRAEHGPFRCPEDLVQVPGVGEGLYAQIAERITVGGE